MTGRKLFAGALVAGVALGAGIASAHEVHYNSNVSMVLVGTMGGIRAQGEVNSPKAGCEPDRLVKLFHKDGGPDTKVGKDTTNNNGEYQINMGTSPDGGTYYAKVIKRNIGSGAHDHICNGDKSPGQTIPN